MLLSGYDIEKLILHSHIKNARSEAINGASLDLHLDGIFYVDDPDASDGFRKVEKSVQLAPGQFCLAATQEIFNLPENIAAEVKLRSSWARRGLNHLLAGWCDPGWYGSALTLEFHNVRPFSITLQKDDSPVQMVFFSLSTPAGKYSYRNKGRYNNDGPGPQISK